MKTKQVIAAVIIGSLMWAALITTAFAGERMPPKLTLPPMPNHDQRQQQEVDVDTNVDVNTQQDQTTTVTTDVNQNQKMGDMVGGSQTMEFKQVRQVHSATAPSVYSTAPCYVGGSAALGLAKINIGGGRAVRDEQCDMRETARMLINAGELELGVALLCMTESGSLLGDSCAYSGDIKAALAASQDRVAFLLNERQIDRKNCKESKDRIFQVCTEK